MKFQKSRITVTANQWLPGFKDEDWLHRGMRELSGITGMFHIMVVAFVTLVYKFSRIYHLKQVKFIIRKLQLNKAYFLKTHTFHRSWWFCFLAWIWPTHLALCQLQVGCSSAPQAFIPGTRLVDQPLGVGWGGHVLSWHLTFTLVFYWLKQIMQSASVSAGQVHVSTESTASHKAMNGDWSRCM